MCSSGLSLANQITNANTSPLARLTKKASERRERRERERTRKRARERSLVRFVAFERSRDCSKLMMFFSPSLCKFVLLCGRVFWFFRSLDLSMRCRDEGARDKTWIFRNAVCSWQEAAAFKCCSDVQNVVPNRRSILFATGLVARKIILSMYGSNL
jgi:hypothetical protein